MLIPFGRLALGAVLIDTEGVGKREVTTILSCEDFKDITTKGSVVLTEKHGAFLKVTVNRFESEGIRHDADVLQVTERSVCTSAMLNT